MNRSSLTSLVSFPGHSNARKSVECALVLCRFKMLDSAISDHKDDAFHRTVTTISFLVDTVVFAFLLAVGVAFLGIDGYKHCRFPASIMLVVAGFANLFLTLMRLFFYYAGTILQGIFNLGILIFGSISVLRKIPKWDAGDEGSPSYCHPFPFLTAAVWTCVLAAWASLVFVIILALCLQGCILGFRNPDVPETPHLRIISHDAEESKRVKAVETRFRPFAREKKKRIKW